MANQEQVEFLRQDIAVWNRWREDNANVFIDLTQADLRGADLWEADLRDANLFGAKLSGANLKEARLIGADLSRADLSEANLRDAYLSGANLSEANLGDAHLSGANLKEARLIGADLIGTSLIGTDLRGADLRKACLIGAELSAANLREAYLIGADLKDANLTGADLGGARLRKAALMGANLSRAELSGAELAYSIIAGTIFGHNDLSSSLGLESITHLGPSTIGTDTIRKSKGKIPIKFLRGCGLSDLDIEYAKLAAPGLDPEQVAQITYEIHRLYCDQPIQFYSCFISYSSRDQDFAQRLHDDLQNNGVRCWFAPEDMKSGRKIFQQINAAIQTHDRLLLILSESSMASEWVKTEIANARQREMKESRQVLFPIGLVEYEKIKAWSYFDGDIGKDSAREIREYFIPDFSNWQHAEAYKSSFERLLRDLKPQ